MPTVDITQPPYNAVADGGFSLATFTMANGSNVLHCTSDTPFSSGMVGKSIIATSILGAFAGATVSTFTSSSQITLSVSNTGASFNGTCVVVWGTNQFTPFNNFRSDYAGLTVTLTIPAGIYFIDNFFSPNAMFDGITNITVNATGATLATGTVSFGANSNYQDQSHAALTKYAPAGQQYIDLNTPASDLSIFSVGNHFCMGGFDLQSNGFPANPFWFEYVNITAIDSNPVSPTYGRLSLAAPLKYSYQANWPNWNIIPQGGVPYYFCPAVISALFPSWDMTIVWNGVTIAQDSQYEANARSVTWNSGTFYGNPSNTGVLPSANQSFTLNNCSYNPGGFASNVEYDKMVSNVVANNTTFHNITMQSPNDTLTMTGCTVASQLFGGARNTSIIDSTINYFQVGPTVYARMDSLLCVNSVINTIAASVTSYVGPFNGASSFNGNFAMANGVITIPKTISVFSECADCWCPPGTHCYFSPTDSSAGLAFFNVLNVSDDGTNMYVTTDWPGTYPTGFHSTPLRVNVHPCASATFSGCSGTDGTAADLNGARPGAPIFSHSKRTFTGTAGQLSDLNPSIILYGKLVSLIFNIITPYTGVNPLNIELLWQGVDTTVLFNYTPAIDAKTGPRTITVVPSSTGGVSGPVSGGELSTLLFNYAVPYLSPAVWIGFDRDISGESPSTWPLFTVEINVDPGFGYQMNAGNSPLGLASSEW